MSFSGSRRKCATPTIWKASAVRPGCAETAARPSRRHSTPRVSVPVVLSSKMTVRRRSDSFVRRPRRAVSGARHGPGQPGTAGGHHGTRLWRVTNILSEITPQKSALNQVPWVRLEAAVLDAAYA